MGYWRIFRIFYDITGISKSFDPWHEMDKAFEDRRRHPSESYLKISNPYEIPATIIRDWHNSTRAAQGQNMLCCLSVVQEGVLIGTIN